MSDWSTRAANLDDALYVFDHLWERGSEELAAYGVTREEWLVLWACMTVVPNCTCAFLYKGHVVAVLGVERCEDVGRTWFQATRAFDDVGVGLTRQMRKVIAELAAKAGLRKAILSSLCISPDAARWYEFLGFSEEKKTECKEFFGRIERNFVKEWG